MGANKFRLRVITPELVKADEDVDMVIMRCTNGDMGVLAGHEPRSAALGYGVMRIIDEEVERRIAVYGGIAEIRDNVLTVLTGEAQWPEDIDRARAETDREQAQKRLQEKLDSSEFRRVEVLLRRALVQIEVSSYPLVNK